MPHAARQRQKNTQNAKHSAIREFFLKPFTQLPNKLYLKKDLIYHISLKVFRITKQNYREFGKNANISNSHKTKFTIMYY